MEIKNIRLELERTKAELSEKDREILILRKEVAALKESQSASRLEESVHTACAIGRLLSLYLLSLRLKSGAIF